MEKKRKGRRKRKEGDHPILPASFSWEGPGTEFTLQKPRRKQLIQNVSQYEKLSNPSPPPLRPSHPHSEKTHCNSCWEREEAESRRRGFPDPLAPKISSFFFSGLSFSPFFWTLSYFSVLWKYVR